MSTTEKRVDSSDQTDDQNNKPGKYLRKGIDNPYFHPVSKRFGRLPSWLDHFNKKDLKTLFKCWLAVWVYTLLMVINSSLRAIGQAVFFGVIVLFMAPPSGVVFMGLLAGGTLLLGVCLGWAWGTITMKAALATRSQAELTARYAELQASATRNTTNTQQASGQSTFAQVAIYNGFMLDARISATYFCMIGLFIYLMARLRVKMPKLTLTSIFSMVVADIYLTIAPLIPTFQGTIAQTLVKPAAIATGIGFAVNVLIFPRSTSHIVLDDMQSLLSPMTIFLEACLLHFQEPTKLLDLGRLQQLKAQTVGAFKTLEGGLGFLKLDASMGRWDAQDVSSLREPIRRVFIGFLGLLQLQIGAIEFKLKDQNLLDMAESIGKHHKEGTKAGHYQVAKTFDFRQRSMHPDAQRLRTESLKALAASGQGTIEACQESLRSIIESLHGCNTRRWIKRPSAQECEENRVRHAEVLDRFRKVKARFASKAAEELWKPHGYLFDDEGHILSSSDGGLPPAGGLMMGLVYEERISGLADALDALLTRIVDLEASRTKTKLWLPSGLQNLWKWAAKKDDPTADSAANTTIPNVSESDSVSSDDSIKSKKRKKKDDPDKLTAASQLAGMCARGGTRRSKAGKFLIGAMHWLTNTEGLFALRILVATIAVGIPAVIPSAAGFYYREKGLWALIMAQTGMMPYTADFVFGLITRLVGTVAGAVVGLAAWYIGAGNGPGNPYGMAAILSVVLIGFMWLRLYLSPASLQAVILSVATCYLVTGYSWADTHIPSYGNPGVGYSVFWRRMLLVIIGFAAATIVLFFPRPPSANRHYRRLLAESLESVKNRFALFVVNCEHPLPDLLDVTETQAIATGELLTGIQPTIGLTKFEFSTSNFDAETLGLVCHLCLNLNQAVTQLLLFTPNLPEKLKNRFTKVTGILEEQLMADIMAVLTLVQQALKSGDPLPLMLPVPLLARSTETLRTRTREMGLTAFTKEILAEPEVRKYCASMSASVHLLSAIDELVIVVKRAVGETSYVDLEK